MATEIEVKRLVNFETAIDGTAVKLIVRDVANRTFSIILTIETLSALIQAERAHASLSRYFSPQLASRLVADVEGYGMEVHRREVASMFTDITSFTSMVEGTAPEVLSTLLNEYMAGMTEIVFAHEGTVAKVMGDGIHILFNAPGDQLDYATRAIACAHDLDTWASRFRRAIES
jgi:class 3 adenylate cyclase